MHYLFTCVNVVLLSGVETSITSVVGIQYYNATIQLENINCMHHFFYMRHCTSTVKSENIG
jgi:hypothetical protein